MGRERVERERGKERGGEEGVVGGGRVESG